MVRLRSHAALSSLAFSGVCCLMLATGAGGQGTPTGTISGYILDPHVLAVAGAMVIVDIPIMRATRGVTANGQGAYSVPALMPRLYSPAIEVNRFKTIHLDGVAMEVYQRARMDFALTIGSKTDSITVSEERPLLSTLDASVRTLIGNRFVKYMPSNGRNFSSLIDLAPRVVRAPSNQTAQGQFSTNGQGPDANYILVDEVRVSLGQSGVGPLPATSAFGGTSNRVSPDALQEFGIEISTFAPEYGRTPGAQISVGTKSGTTALHRTALDYFRRTVLDVNDRFASAKGPARPPLQQNDFGGVWGADQER